MATTQQPRVDGDRPRIQPDAVFDECIWHNPEICNNCFGRIRSIETEEIHVGKNNQRQLEFEHRSQTTAATTDHDVEAKGETGLVAVRDADGRVTGLEPIDTHSAQYRETTRTTCLQCGSVGCLATDATLSQREALQCVDTLLARLREQGIPVSERHLRATVRRGKARRETQGFDREIFTAAVKVAVRHG